MNIGSAPGVTRSLSSSSVTSAAGETASSVLTISGIINDGAEASIITPANIDVAPDTLADLPEGATDMLGRVTNIESSSPVDGVDWNIGFLYDPAELEAAGLSEENLKVAYLDPAPGSHLSYGDAVDSLHTCHSRTTTARDNVALMA